MEEKIKIPVYHVYRKGIRNFSSIDNFLENVNSSKIYLIDDNTFRGREINFKVLKEISPVIETWYEANIRWIDDVTDILVAGAEISVMAGEKINERLLKNVLKITNNVAIHSDDDFLLEKFIENGGFYVITDIPFLKGKRFIIKDEWLIEV
ncbi:MAG: hypothetical protein ACP5RZ_02745 [Thermoplasmata archaeon]